MWILPTDEQLKQEYHVECELKGNNYFASEDEFLRSAKKSRLEVITPEMDTEITYRSRTSSFDQLHNLIKGYASYPEFRNEGTLKNLYHRIERDLSMAAPIVLRFPNGSMRVLAGNTRMDVAFQLNVEVKALVINI